MFWRIVEATGWTWDYVRSLPMPRFWRIVGAMVGGREPSAAAPGEAPSAGLREVRRASFGG